MWKIIIPTILSLVLTVVLVLLSSSTSRVIQVALYHDSVNVINGRETVDIYGKTDSVLFKLQGVIKDTSVGIIKLNLFHKGKKAGVFPIPVDRQGRFTLPLQFSLDDLDTRKEYTFILETPIAYIDSGSIQLFVMAEVYGKSGVSALIIVAIGTVASLLQIFQLFYPKYSKKRTSRHNFSLE